MKSSYWAIKERIKKCNGQEETKTQQLQSRPDVEPQKEQDDTHVSQVTMQSNKDVEMDASAPGYSIQEIETIIIFDLCALVEIATSKSAVLGVSKRFCVKVNPVSACIRTIQKKLYVEYASFF